MSVSFVFVVPCNNNVPAIIAPERVPNKGCLGVVPLNNNMQQHARDRRAAEAVEVREECLSRRRGVQRQRERDRRATETEAQREGRLALYR